MREDNSALKYIWVWVVLPDQSMQRSHWSFIEMRVSYTGHRHWSSARYQIGVQQGRLQGALYSGFEIKGLWFDSQLGNTVSPSSDRTVTKESTAYHRISSRNSSSYTHSSQSMGYLASHAKSSWERGEFIV